MLLRSYNVAKGYYNVFLDLCLRGHIMLLRATIYWVCYYDSWVFNVSVLCYCLTTEGQEFVL